MRLYLPSYFGEDDVIFLYDLLHGGFLESDAGVFLPMRYSISDDTLLVLV